MASLTVLHVRRGFGCDMQERRRGYALGIDTAMRRTMIISSLSYPNGDDGNSLSQANGLTVRFALANPDECTDFSIDPNAPINAWDWVTEHILELQLIPRAIEFMVTGEMPAIQGLPPYRSSNKPLSWDIAQLLGQDYSQWAGGFTTLTEKPIDRIFNALGSNDNPGVLVNAERDLNSMKGRIFNSKQPIGDAVWKALNRPSVLNAEVAIDELRMVVSVFEYLNIEVVNRLLGSAYTGSTQEWRNFEDVVKKARGATIHTVSGWREFMTNFMNRLAEWVQTWVVGRIHELRSIWQNVYA